MGRTFQRIHASIAGKFDGNLRDKIPQWIRANGGQFSRDVNPSVTHLIATKQAYKENAPLVHNAKMLGTVKIVTYDWLEDSLQAATRKPKLEEPYLLQNLMSTSKPENKAIKITPTKVSKNVSKKESKPVAPKRQLAADPFLAPKGKKKPVRRTYMNKQGVVYSTTLFRPSKPPTKAREKYQLTIFETITEPHTYSTYAKFSRVGKSTIEVLALPKSTIEIARVKFNNFFIEKTGKEWEERDDGQMSAPKRNLLGDYLRGTRAVSPQETDDQLGCDDNEPDSGDEDVSMEDQGNTAESGADGENEANEASAIEEDNQ